MCTFYEIFIMSKIFIIQSGARKSSLISGNQSGGKFLSLTRPHDWMCIRIYLFHFKKFHTNSFFFPEIFLFLLDKLKDVVINLHIYCIYLNHVSKKILTAAISFSIWLDQYMNNFSNLTNTGFLPYLDFFW